MSQITKKPAPSEARKPSPSAEAVARPVSKPAEAPGAVHEIAVLTAEKTVATPASDPESAHKTTKAVVTIGTDKIKEIFAGTTQEARKTHARAFDIGRESSESLTRALDALERAVNDIMASGRQHLDVALEVNNIIVDITRSTTAEIVKNANQNFASNLDIYGELVESSNVNDVMEAGNKWLATNLETAFASSSRISEMFFQIISEASEPVNEYVLESAERFGKTFAA